MIAYLPKDEWLRAKNSFTEQLSPFISYHRDIREKGLKHPVYDFLFSYYSFSRGQLLRWSPGASVGLEADSINELDWSEFFISKGSYFLIDKSLFPLRRKPYLTWAINYLRGISSKPPVFHCFGLHEWAMLYNYNEKKHSELNLRVSNEILDETLNSHQLSCTHYDAYRFFSPEAVPKNKWSLSREEVCRFDQPACIHVNMDLYKFGYKIAPFISSDLLFKLFQLALKAREIDMRASPYDLTDYGFYPIKIETKEGREEYVRAQKALFEEGRGLREELIEVYEFLNNVTPMQMGIRL